MLLNVASRLISTTQQDARLEIKGVVSSCKNAKGCLLR